MRSGPGAARTILLFHIISARPSKQPLVVRIFLKVYLELGSYFVFLQERMKDIIIMGDAGMDASQSFCLPSVLLPPPPPSLSVTWTLDLTAI